MNILAIIPARSGSKSVADKNIREIGGIPMLAWSVRHALESRYINRVILSTDSEKYAAIGRSYGAETPFIRPEEYATDTALDIEVFEHALRWLKDNENYEADIVVQLRPTYPKRNSADIDKMIEMLINHPEADSVRSVAPAGEVPYKMWLKADEGEDGIVPLIKDIPECYNMPRQQLPNVYYQNACIDVMRGSTVIRKHSMTGDRILGYFMEENLDIDTEIEFLKAELEVMKNLKADAEPEIFERQPENLQETLTAESGIFEKQPENLQGALTAGSGTSEKQPENLQEALTAESEATKKTKGRNNGEASGTGQNAEAAVTEMLLHGGKRLVFDIDGVIAKLEPNNNYALSEPSEKMIEVVNRLYDAGNTIVLHTARGYVTGKDWKEVTENQLKKWGLRYHELHFGKPNADYYIDDKMLDMKLLSDYGSRTEPLDKS